MRERHCERPVMQPLASDGVHGFGRKLRFRKKGTAMLVCVAAKKEGKLLGQESTLGRCCGKLTGCVCQPAAARGDSPLHTGCTKENRLGEITGSSLLASATLLLSSLSTSSSLHLRHKHLFTVHKRNRTFLLVISREASLVNSKNL